jgi:hypothetical protein
MNICLDELFFTLPEHLFTRNNFLGTQIGQREVWTGPDVCAWSILLANDSIPPNIESELKFKRFFISAFADNGNYRPSPKALISTYLILSAIQV